MEESEERPKLFKQLESESKLLKFTPMLCSTFAKKGDAGALRTR
jgi:hypothetical protein